LLVCFSLSLLSQSLNDTLQLREMEIKANLVPGNSGFKKIRFDSVILLPYRDADLSTALSRISTIFIKEYSPGSLATTSFRGTPANHTQVEWNGISLSNPMLGQSDLSQIPVSAFDEIEVLYGAAGLTKTSGAFGGVVNLVTSPDWNKRINASLSQTLASFDNYTTLADVTAGTQSFQSHSRINFNSALNDFPYTDYYGERVYQHDAKVLQYGLTEEAFFKIRDKHLLTARVWYSYDNRNIPPVSNGSAAYDPQTTLNKNLRALAEYKLVEKFWNLSVRSALVNQFMNYRNEGLLIDNDHRSNSWINTLRFTWTGVKNLTVKPGLDYQYDHVRSDAYDGLKTRNTIGAYLEASYVINKHLRTQTVLREDMIDGKFMPFIPSLGLEYKPFNKVNLYFSANASRNYRYPTLNDLYWSLWGNPDLSPEYDNGLEGGATFNIPLFRNTLFLESEVSVYGSWMDDMIKWSPLPDNPSIWKPQNVKQVLARGVEASLNFKWEIWKLTVTSASNYSYCKSTYQQTTSANDNSLGKQVEYVPENTFNGTINFSLYRFLFGYNLNFVDKRYTSPDNQSYMPAYSLSNIIFGKSFCLPNFVISLQLKVNNLFNIDYQSVNNWPMPGINYGFTVRIEFNK
jgi:iron complex outermembrane receptor protein